MALLQKRWILPLRSDPRTDRCAEIAFKLAWIEALVLLAAWTVFMQPRNGGANASIGDIPFYLVNAAAAVTLLCIGVVGLMSRSTKKVGSIILVAMNTLLIGLIANAFLGFRAEAMERTMTELAEDVQHTAAASQCGRTSPNKTPSSAPTDEL